MTDHIYKTTLALLAGFLMLAQSAIAQDSNKQTPPEGGTPKDFKLPAKQQFTLDNGLKVTLVPFGSVPKVTVSARVMSGNLNEGSNTWLSDLTADMMEQGTSSRSAEDVAREAAEMGGSLTIGVGLDQTQFSGDALSEFAPQMIDLMADVMINPAMPDSEMERLRRDAHRNLEVALNDPSTMALIAYREALYGDHPYGRLYPTADQLDGYTRDQVAAFHADNFGAQRTHVFVAGTFDADAVKSAIKEAFGGWKEGLPALAMPPEPKLDRQYVEMVDRTDASQSNVILGLVTIDPSQPDFVAMQTTNTMLGGAFSSRITSNIREDKGYTYSPSSQVSVRRGDGYWAQQAAITTEDTGAALHEIYYEINRLRDEPPPAEELKAIQNYMAGIFTLQNSTNGGIINQLNNLDLHGLDDDYLTGYVSRVYALTPEDISATATRYLRPEDMTLVVVGDRAKIGEELTRYLEPKED